MKTVVLVLCAAIALAATALAEPYWIAWEGDDFPENQGWERNYGNWDGQWQGQANRTLDNGILTIDSLHDTGVYDGYEYFRPGAMDPAQGEVFIAEWRVEVESVIGGWWYDTSFAVNGDDSWVAGFEFSEDTISSGFELNKSASFESGQMHTFRLISPDMREYGLYIDDVLAFTGGFMQLASSGRVAWGDGVQGAASVSHWDYVRFGVVPEPGAAVLLGTVLLAALLAGRIRS